MDLDNYKQIVLCCVCGHKSEVYYGLYQSEKGELLALWRCGQCKRDSMAVIAGMTPMLPYHSDDDVKFLKSCNISSKEADE